MLNGLRKKRREREMVLKRYSAVPYSRLFNIVFLEIKSIMKKAEKYRKHKIYTTRVNILFIS